MDTCCFFLCSVGGNEAKTREANARKRIQTQTQFGIDRLDSVGAHPLCTFIVGLEGKEGWGVGAAGDVPLGKTGCCVDVMAAFSFCCTWKLYGLGVFGSQRQLEGEGDRGFSI